MSRTFHTARRSGVVLICVLACIVVVTSLVATALMSASRARREARTHQQMSQVKWMLDLGVRRASKALLGDESYSGETLQWSDPAWPEHELSIVIKLGEHSGTDSEEVQVQALMTRILSREASEQTGVNEEVRRSYAFRIPRKTTD